MLWTLSLIRPRWCFLPQRRGREGPVGSAESSKLKTSLCSTGGLQTWHAGGGGAGDILTPWHQTFHLASLSLGNTSSVLQGKSLTALILAGEQSATLGFIIQATPKNCAADHHHATSLFIQVVMWCGGRSVGVKALDSSVERLWFHLQSTSRQFLLSFQSNIPQCVLVYSPLLTITLLRPSHPLIQFVLVSLFSFF